MVYSFLTQYWGLISMFLGGVVYVATHYTWAKSFAKDKAIKLMFSAEARAEQLALSIGTEKFDWVVSSGYDLLPAPVRIFISKPLFSSIVQGLFDEAIKFAKAHEIVKPATIPNLSVSANGNVVANNVTVTQITQP
jgi:hypothetical protein